MLFRSRLPVRNGSWELVADGFEFPEGPAWDKERGVLYVSSCSGGRISRIKNGQVETFLTDSDDSIGKTNGLFVLDNGDVLACDFGKDRKSTRLNSSHTDISRMPSSA